MALKLYFLINSLAGGGAEKVFLKIADFLKPKKIFLLEKDIDYPVDHKKVIFLSNYEKNTSPILKNLFILFYAFKLLNYLNKNSLVISFLERANFTNVLTKIKSKHKAIISVRMDPIEGYKGIHSVNKILLKILYPKADLIIVNSQGTKQSLVNLGLPQEKIKVIYNPLSFEEIKNKLNEGVEKFLENENFIINVGRLTKQKAQWHLLRIFRELKNEYQDLKLLILGDGELKDYLVKLSEKLNLKTYVWDRDEMNENFDVYFMGFQKNPYKYLSKAKIFIFPSLYEGLPNALIEALACGVTVISADCKSGPREILAPNTDFRYQTDKLEFTEYGILMPVLEGKFLSAGDPLTEREKIWVETIKNVLNDKKLLQEYSQKSLKRAYDFDIEKIVQEWQEVLKEFNLESSFDKDSNNY